MRPKARRAADKAGQDPGDTGEVAGEKECRGVEQKIAGGAAKAGRERPGARYWEVGEGEGGGERTAEPRDERARGTTARRAEHHAPAPDDWRHQYQRGGDAEELRHQVGDRRAGEAQNIANRAVCGVAQARVIDRPGGEARGDGGREGQDGEAGEGGDVAPHDPAERTVDGRNRGGTRRTHTVYPSNRDRP